MIKFLQKMVEEKNANFVFEIFCENIIKNITSVPGHPAWNKRAQRCQEWKVGETSCRTLITIQVN
jgi:hypothetical protein